MEPPGSILLMEISPERLPEEREHGHRCDHEKGVPLLRDSRIPVRASLPAGVMEVVADTAGLLAAESCDRVAVEVTDAGLHDRDPALSRGGHLLEDINVEVVRLPNESFDRTPANEESVRAERGDMRRVHLHDERLRCLGRRAEGHAGEFPGKITVPVVVSEEPAYRVVHPEKGAVAIYEAVRWIERP